MDRVATTARVATSTATTVSASETLTNTLDPSFERASPLGFGPIARVSTIWWVETSITVSFVPPKPVTQSSFCDGT